MSGTAFFTMSVGNDRDLIRTLKELSVETGSLSENAISAWFDTDSEENKYLLKWLCNLSQCNILSPLERLENEEIANSSIASEDTQTEFNNVLLDYPKLMDIDDNLVDIMLLENEIQMLREEEAEQEQLIAKTKQVGEKLSIDIKKLTSEELSTSVGSSELETCKQLCLKLDTELQHRIELCVNPNNFHHASLFSNVDVRPYLDFSEIASAYFNSFLKQNFEYSLEASAGNTIFDVDAGNDELINMKERIFRSSLNYLHKQRDEKSRLAELDELKACATSFSANTSLWSDYQSDLSIQAIDNKFRLMEQQLRNYAHKLSVKYIRTPQINVINNKLDESMTKLNNARSFKDILQQILQYQDLLMIMYGIEQENCVCTRKHFGHFLEISDTLKKHKQHLDKVDKCVDSRPSEEKLNFIQRVNNLSSVVQSDSIFREVTEVFIDAYKEKAADNAVMTDFLKSGPTSQLVAVPHPLVYSLMEINSIILSQKTKIMETVDLQKSQLLRLDKDKWFKKRRLLWVYFMKDRSTLINVLDEIKSTVDRLKVH